MNHHGTTRSWQGLLFAVGIGWLLAVAPSQAADDSKGQPPERREELSLADAALRALKNNLDISISRQTKESRLTDIVVEQAKFDPTLSVNGQYNRTVNPLNRPVFGGTGGTLSGITTFDQRSESVTVDATTNLLTGGNIDLNYSPARTNVNQNVATGFLFNPAWTGGL
ncbi:MAG TPA: TolC family protein, partial [Nitrospira sp.]